MARPDPDRVSIKKQDGEYVVRRYDGNVLVAEYFTDDKADAEETKLKMELEALRQRALGPQQRPIRPPKRRARRS